MRNPKNINEQLDVVTLCDFYGGAKDGYRDYVDAGATEKGFSVRRGKDERVAVYERESPRRFVFVRYE